MFQEPDPLAQKSFFGQMRGSSSWNNRCSGRGSTILTLQELHSTIEVVIT